MKLPCDLHNHSNFSDGRNSMEEMVQAAVTAGLKTFGISDPSYTAFDTSYCMPLQGYGRYNETIRYLKEKYRNQIDFLGGIEFDYYSDIIPEGLDYVIGSVHYIKVNGEYLPVDKSQQDLEQIVEKYFEGDCLAMCEVYYDTVSNIVEKTDCDIIGHFDLISKFNEGNRYFDEQADRYIQLWQKALDKLIGYGKCFEINYGAVNTGRRSIPYLSEPMQQYIRERNGRMIVSSDNHWADRPHYWHI